MNAKRDENYVTVAMGISDTDGATTLPLSVDPVTGRLLIDIDGQLTDGLIMPAMVGRDENWRETASAVTDDADETVSPLIVDNRNNYLYIDLLIE